MGNGVVAKNFRGFGESFAHKSFQLLIAELRRGLAGIGIGGHGTRIHRASWFLFTARSCGMAESQSGTCSVQRDAKEQPGGKKVNEGTEPGIGINFSRTNRGAARNSPAVYG